MIPDLEQREVVVKPLPPYKIYLEEDLDDGIKVSSAEEEDKRANVIFKSDEYQDIITVNLTTGKMKGAVSFSTGRTERPESEYPIPIKPIKSETLLPGNLPDEGVVTSEEYEGLSGSGSSTEKEVFAQMLKDIDKKDDRIKDLLKDNDYEILEITRSEPIITKTEAGAETQVKTVTIILEKESIGEDYRITLDMENITVKSIEKE